MEHIQIFIKTLSGSIITLQIQSNAEISNIKNEISDRTGIPVTQFRVMYGGRNVDESQNIKYYGIQNESTLSIGLRLLSSLNSITLKLPNEGHHNYTETSTQTSFNCNTTLKDIIKTNKLSSNTQIIHNNTVLDEGIKIMNIPNIYNNSILHTRTGKQFNQAKYIQFRVINRKKCIRLSPLKKIQNILDFATPINVIIHKYLQMSRFPADFCNKYCPYKAVNIQYKRHQLSLKLETNKHHVKMFGYTKDLPGAIPNISLQSLSDIFSSFCDCCKPKTPYNYERKIRSVGKIQNYHQYKTNHPIIIEIVLSEVSFFFKDKYYINGEFYDKYDYNEMKNKINFQFYPILHEPRKSNQKLLVCRYVQDNFYDIIPVDVMNLINLFYPVLYGVQYDINEYNPNLNDEFEQKTNEFEITDGVECYLKYGGFDDIDEQGLHIVVVFKQNSDIKAATILCCMHCKLTQQSYSYIHNIDNIPNLGIDSSIAIPVMEFPVETSLQCLICNIQILKLNYNVNDTIYYPLKWKQNSYLLEWCVNCELLKLFEKCVNDSLFGCFESIIFYEMFVIRIYPNGFEGHDGNVILSIQCVALPTDKWSESMKCEECELKAECKIYEEGMKYICLSTTFNYSSSTSSVKLMKSKQIKDKRQLRFRVEIYNLDFVLKKQED
eukprot:319531_1